MTARRVFDAHLHIVDPRFPLVANQGFRPAPFTVADYRAATAGLGVVRGAVVAGSFQPGVDWLLAALAELGEGFVGVAAPDPGVTDAEILALHAAGVRAVRANLVRGDATALDGLARRVWDLAGWHTELYVDARDLPDLEPRLRHLPRLCIDHLGLSADGQPALLRLVERGARVKATGFGRVDPGLDIPQALRAVHAVNPAALLAGTDLPSTRARRPFAPADLDLIAATLGPDAAKALHDNAADFYGSGR